MNICKNCHAEVPENSRFCTKCGTPVEQEAAPDPQAQINPLFNQPAQPHPPQQDNLPQQMAPQQVAQPNPPPQPPIVQPWVPASPAARPRKSKAIVPIAIVVGLLLVAGVGALALNLLVFNQKALPAVSYSYIEEAVPEIEYQVAEQVFPSLYRSLDSMVTLTASIESGEREVLIKAEVPGFTQPYEQKLKLTPQITKIQIHPPLLTGEINLNSEKDGQLVLSVTDADTGKAYVQDSRNIRIMSKYDVVWWTEELKDSNNDNILAWMTPDSPGVLKLKRDAVDYLSYLTDGKIQSIVGYQDYGFENKSDNTWVQIIALQGAISDIEQVRYNNAAFSISSDVHQRVMLPDEVLRSQSGICIETSLLMASALQSAGMHVMLIFPPGHAQVAVEAWPGSGEYFLIETTNLPMAFNSDGFNSTVKYLTKDQWIGYIYGTGEYTLGECYVLDCELGQKLGIMPLSN